VVNQLFGGPSGFGLFPLTFDWTIVSGYLTSPLIFPWYAIANMVGGILFFFTFVALGMKYTGVWYADYLPVVNSHAFDNMGKSYNVTMILDEATARFNETKYNAYSPLYLPTQFALAYGLSFAAVAAVIVHVSLYHGPEIWVQFKLARNQEDDVHMRLMKKYRDAPDWWYGVLFLIMIGISLAVVCGWNTDFPWWAYIVCIIIACAWTLPVGIVQAITNWQIGLNVLTELCVSPVDLPRRHSNLLTPVSIIGYMLPGRPLTMMMFKNYGSSPLTPHPVS